jgi:hypothetical protein
VKRFFPENWRMKMQTAARPSRVGVAFVAFYRRPPSLLSVLSFFDDISRMGRRRISRERPELAQWRALAGALQAATNLVDNCRHMVLYRRGMDFCKIPSVDVYSTCRGVALPDSESGQGEYFCACRHGSNHAERAALFLEHANYYGGLVALFLSYLRSIS